MASSAQKADLARLAKLAALLTEARQITDILTRPTLRTPGMEVLLFALRAAQERAVEFHAREHVQIHNSLPEGYQSVDTSEEGY